MPPDRYRIDTHVDAETRAKALSDDVLRGLTSRPKTLPPKYFYDAAGSALFDEITRLPEYYLTRVEDELLRTCAPAVMRRATPDDIVEIGAGTGVKIRRFMDAVDGARRSVRYVPVDLDETTMRATAARLTVAYAFLSVHGVVGDFERHLAHVPPAIGRRLVVFLGSTIGNLDRAPCRDFLAEVRRLLRDGDRFLVGVDLVKDHPTLEAAYNDAAGVTGEFNRNILRVVNHGLGGDFRPEAFRHHAWYNEAERRIEMHLVAEARLRARLRRLGIAIEVEAGESIWTENSYKFTRESTVAMFEPAGLRLESWHVDDRERFALALAAPA